MAGNKWKLQVVDTARYGGNKWKLHELDVALYGGKQMESARVGCGS